MIGGMGHESGAGDADALRERLEREDPHFRSLAARHRECDERVRRLLARPKPTADDELEAARLKKRKLALRDEMETLLRVAARDRA